MIINLVDFDHISSIRFTKLATMLTLDHDEIVINVYRKH